jgi:SAM-dependent methyltransferase
MAESITLLEVPYADPAVLNFVCRYYFNAGAETIRNRLLNGTFAVLECTRCKLIYQRNIPDPDFMRELYEEWILDGDYLAPTSTAPPPDEYFSYMVSEVTHLLMEQRRIVGPDRRIKVLDFGMGWSAWLQMARSLGAEVYGAELSESKIAYAHSIGIPVVTMSEIRDMKFDLICTEQVFEHVPEPADLLQVLCRSLTSEGYIKISVPPGDSIKKVLSSWSWQDAYARKDRLMPVQPLEHINCFATEALDALAGRFGLERAPVSTLRAMAYSIGWHGPRAAIKNLLRPVYRFMLKKGSYAIYRHRKGHGEQRSN